MQTPSDARNIVVGADGDKLEQYFDAVRHEVGKLTRTGYHGNIVFQFNMTAGVVRSLNMVLNRSVKF